MREARVTVKFDTETFLKACNAMRDFDAAFARIIRTIEGSTAHLARIGDQYRQAERHREQRAARERRRRRAQCGQPRRRG